MSDPDLRPLLRLGEKTGGVTGVPTSDTRIPSLPWTWTGGYPQRITGPDATLIAEVFENPDMPAVIAPLICDAVNAYHGIDGSETYDF